MKIKKSENIIEQYVIFGITALSLLFWDSLFTYPVKIFVVLFHEISHVIITIISGGKVLSINFSFNLSGSTVTKGGSPIFIAASGYLGSLTIGSLIFLSSQHKNLRKWLAPTLSLTILLVAVNLINGGFQVFISLVIASIIFFLPKYFGETINRVFLKIIGLLCCLYVIVDIKQDLLTTTLRETDTQILEYLTGAPALLIGSVWFLISIIVVFSLIRNMTIFK